MSYNVSISTSSFLANVWKIIKTPTFDSEWSTSNGEPEILEECECHGSFKSCFKAKREADTYPGYPSLRHCNPATKYDITGNEVKYIDFKNAGIYKLHKIRTHWKVSH